MKDFTNEEAKALRGTEFTYVFEDGDTVQAFIAQVDLEVGLTCKALTRLTDRDQYELWGPRDEETNGDYDNVTCKNLENSDVSEIQEVLKNIVEKGEHRQPSNEPLAGILGIPMDSCAF